MRARGSSDVTRISCCWSATRNRSSLRRSTSTARCACAPTWPSASARSSLPPPNSPCWRCCGRTWRRQETTISRPIPTSRSKTGLPNPPSACASPKRSARRRRSWRSSRHEMRLRKLDAAAHNRFRRGIRQISRGRAIVTDRLHVHICSLLLGRPHAVLDNSYGKFRRFMSAFSGGTDLSYKATSLDDGIAWARRQAGSRSRPMIRPGMQAGLSRGDVR